MKVYNVVTATANRGLGLFTAIGLGIHSIFGGESHMFQEKKESVLKKAKDRLMIEINKIGDYEIESVTEFWTGKLDVSLVAIVRGTKEIEENSEKIEPQDVSSKHAGGQYKNARVITKINLITNDGEIKAGTSGIVVTDDGLTVIVKFKDGQKLRLQKRNVEIV